MGLLVTYLGRRRADTPSFHARRSASRSPRESTRHENVATAQGSPLGAGRAAPVRRDAQAKTVISGFAKERRTVDQSSARALTLREGHRRALAEFPSCSVRDKGCRSLFERGR